MNWELVIIIAAYCCAELLLTLLPSGNRYAHAARVGVAVAAICTIAVYVTFAKTRIDAEERAHQEQERAREERRERNRYIREHMIRHPE